MGFRWFSLEACFDFELDMTMAGNPVHAYNRGCVLLRLHQWQAASRDFDLAAARVHIESWNFKFNTSYFLSGKLFWFVLKLDSFNINSFSNPFHARNGMTWTHLA